MAPTTRRSLLSLGPLASLFLALPLLTLAARHDRHWRTDTTSMVDHRVGAGLFLAGGLAAAAPALVTAFFGRRRAGAIVVVVVVLAIALLCETVVSVAPDPWFAF